MRKLVAAADLFEASPLPKGLDYQADFLTAGEEATLLSTIAPLPFREATFQQYTARRRVVRFGRSYDAEREAWVESEPLPDWLAQLQCRVARRQRVAPDAFAHALVTEYRPGTPIGWHRDKPQYGSVVGISLAGVGRMRWRPYAHQDAQHTVSLDLARRSMYVMRGPIRWQWQHSMTPMRELRYSITFRTRATAAERTQYV